MLSKPRPLLAFCTLLVITGLLGPRAARAGEQQNIAHYRNERLQRGARVLPTAATLEYRAALAELKKGNRAAAERRLGEAIQLNPNQPDAYFTLAALKARRLDFDAAVVLVNAFRMCLRSFSFQSLFALNLVVFVPYVLLLVSAIVCLSLAVKYLPFAAHKIRELIEKRFRAACPGLTAYLLLLLPLAFVPSVIVALAYITIVCWMFMYRREKALVFMLLVPFILLGLSGNALGLIDPIADPRSLTSLIAKGNDAPGSASLIDSIEGADAEGLEAEASVALGLLNQRHGNYLSASRHFFEAVSLAPDNAIGYINLGNLHFLQGDYEKAVEGYRKAESADPRDPVIQHDLAQAYIKLLLMKEASQALERASTLRIDDVKSTYTREALKRSVVLPRTFSSREMWKIAEVEGTRYADHFIDERMKPLTRFGSRTSGWILLCALVTAIVLSRAIAPWKLTFQCSNCGALTCVNCCSEEHDMSLCKGCAEVVHGITSEKVIDALLRQRRQSVLVSRRKPLRLLHILVPGLRDMSYGKILRACGLAGLFSLSVVQLFTKGYIVDDPAVITNVTPMWKTIVPAAGVFYSYLQSIFTRHNYEFKTRRARKAGSRSREIKAESLGGTRAA